MSGSACHARGVTETLQTCARCGATAPAPEGGLPAGWSLGTSDRGVDRLCGDCTRTHVRAIEARLDEDWW
jgi:hypothetical protein